MDRNSELSKIKGVGAALQAKFSSLGLETVDDLIQYYPRRYDDYSAVTPISTIRPGPVTIQAVIKQATGRYVRRGMHITEAVASDDSGSVRLVWFNQPYRAAHLKTDEPYFISGKFELRVQKMAIMSPACELVSSFPLNTARIVPIYRETKGLNSNQIRKVVGAVVPLIKALPETLPAWLVKYQKLISHAQAVLQMHFPENATTLAEAKKRLGFEEVFQLSLSAMLNKQLASTEHALAIPFKQSLAKQFVGNLPFTLTDDQRKVIWQLYKDIALDSPMNRLVEGDVGSGKTVVATMTALMAMEQGHQTAFLAPTELLARQHADTIHTLLEPLGFASQVSLLVGSMKPKQKSAAREAIKSGAAKMIVGTHALLQEKVAMHSLALVIVDEQHRFGVEQRRALLDKSGHLPHLLSMTATPIPRSLALTLYGELDISIIAAKPANRLPIITKIASPNSRAALYKTIDQQIEQGRQVFVVCPLVNPSLMMQDKQSAEQVYTKLRQGPFKQRRVGLLHGQLKPADKTAIMQDFVDHKLDILVATTVVEVGVDVPNATVMLIENADRFGLAQLHQLRGRVGRSSHQGYCYLMMSDSSAPTRRLRAMESTSDGFKLAELDLELRGPGAIYGTFQHGALDLRVAKLSDTKLIASARAAAVMFIKKDEDLVKYKQLRYKIEQLRAVTNLN